jgi:uncharacterized protein (DUF1800 family)
LESARKNLQYIRRLKVGRMLRLIRITLILLTLPLPAIALSPEDARHLLARTGFAATPQAIEDLAPMSQDAAVARLLNQARKTPVTAAPAWTRDWAPPKRRMKEMSEAQRRALKDERRAWALELKTWWVREMLATPAPITEVMTLFWHNHFTSELKKVKSPVLMYRQNLLLRRHALGNFATLLRQVARDPAMLLYLDGARSREGEPNENFARELLEFFTLGEGHYSEADIKAAARAFTGWTIDRKSGAFTVRPRWHDRGIKEFLGWRSAYDGDGILDILLNHPRTSEQVVEKLWRAFVSDSPERAEVRRLAALFRDSDYEIKPLLQALFTSPAFRAPEARGRLIKSPIDLLVGTARQFQIPLEKPDRLVHLSRRLGQDLFDPPNVKGWPGGTAWITTDSLLERQSLLARVTGTDDSPAMDAPDRKRSKRKRSDRKRDRPRAREAAMAMAPRTMIFERWARDLPSGWNDAAGITTLLLPIAPADGAVLDRDGSGALVRRLLNDPVYQLK